MSRTNLLKLGRSARGRVASVTQRAPILRENLFSMGYDLNHATMRQSVATRPFTTTPRVGYPLSAEALKTAKAASITDSEYQELSNAYLDILLTRYEELQDQEGEVDVEFSSGVMTVKIPERGTYVINKQPPNKQIWLSSPVSGPKRYDYVVVNEGQDSKQDTATGNWVYLRDGSTLSELLLEETGVVMDQAAAEAAE
ncbi:Frataxin-like domain-containing protein [Hypoxylon sp. FL1150]|nr:Frataxin-like domain-containing protein [Hypoxylon sp. FL1150]